MRIRVPQLAGARWPLHPARNLFERRQRPARETDGIVTAFRDGVVTLRANRRTEGFTNAIQQIGYQGIRSGDLVIHSMDGFAGAIGVSDSDGKASPVVHCYRPAPGVDARYYAYLLRQLAVSGFVQSLARGIRERSTAFDVETFRSLVLPVPSPTEQTAIADFLDTETARIDALVDKKRRLRKLLMERRESWIASQVVRSVDTPPVGWRVTQLRQYLQRNRRTGYPSAPLLTVSRVSGVEVRTLGSDLLPTPSSDLSSYQLVQVGDLVMNQLGKPHGSIGVSAHRGIISPAYFVARIDPAVNPRFVHHLLRTRRLVSEYERRGKLMPPSQFDIGWEQFRTIQVALPSRQEQGQIASRVDSYCSEVDRLIKQIDNQVDLLAEHRHALVTASVAGQLVTTGVKA